MDIYEGDITALLGHNGAGKTTTMLMLTGQRTESVLHPSWGISMAQKQKVTSDIFQTLQYRKKTECFTSTKENFCIFVISTCEIFFLIRAKSNSGVNQVFF